MGKRTRDKTDEELERKIKRLKEELEYRKRPPPPASSRNENHSAEYYDDASSYNYRDEVELDEYPVARASDEEDRKRDVSEPVPTDDVDPPAPPPDENTVHNSQDVHDPGSPPPNRVKSVVIPIENTTQPEEETIPAEIMEVLGESKKSKETFGKKIPQGVSERLGNILLEGLAKEQKDTLLTKTLIIPENFQLLKAPNLNAEVASVLTDPAKNRDKRLEKLQNQLGSGIAGLVNLTTDLINKDLEKSNMEIIKRISEVNQVLLDLHYEETMDRRRLAIPLLDKNFINIIQNVKRGEYLFGDSLGENIKTSKSIEKSSLQIKKPVPPQSSTSRKPQGQAGNSRAPARQTGATSAPRAQPATSRYYPPPPPAASRRPPPAPRRAPPPPPPRSQSQDHQHGRQR